MLHPALVDEDVLAHEVKVSASIWVWMARRDHVAVPTVEPHLDQVLTMFLEIEGLQVVNDCEVVNVAPARRDIPMLVALVFILKLLDQLLYRPKQMVLAIKDKLTGDLNVDCSMARGSSTAKHGTVSCHFYCLDSVFFLKGEGFLFHRGCFRRDCEIGDAAMCTRFFKLVA